MTFKPAIWFPISTVLSVLMVVSAGFAAGDAEPWHAGIHAALAVGFAVWAVRLRLGASALQGRLEAMEAEPARLGDLEAEMNQLRQELNETQERLDFAERMLAQRPDPRRVGPERQDPS